MVTHCRLRYLIEVIKNGYRYSKIDAIYMAILHGHITATRSAFKISIQIAIDEKLDQIIDFLEEEDMSFLVEDIKKLKHL
ncbi:MAG: hypothetical protein IIA06_12755 [Proteobacteria bacterium]|nr:hypothetical protein [Pseudomonadota bacterium]